jgi:hypothetical protein
MPRSLGSISITKSSTKVPITTLPMFLAGIFSHKNEAVFCWVREGFYGFGLWEAPMLWGEVIGVTLVSSYF